MGHLHDTGNFEAFIVSLERLLDEYALQLLSPYKYTTDAPENILLYLWNKEMEIKNIRTVIVSKSMKADKETLRIRLGWMNENLRKQGLAAIERAWSGLTRSAVDKFGNVHGVCRGSLYSFTPEYYKNVLLWNLNDAHGTGIVMLAGIEVDKLRNMLAGQS